MSLIIDKGGKYEKEDWINNFGLIQQLFALLRSDVDGKVAAALLGENSGVATLSNTGKVLQTALNAEKISGQALSDLANMFISALLKGAANGVAELDGSGKLKTAQIPDTITAGLVYKGVWNANTNNPTIPTAASGNNNWFYVVGTAGATTVSGISSWAVGDWIISNGSAWQKIPSTQSVLSVAGKAGNVTLSLSDISGLVSALEAKAYASDIATALATKASTSSLANKQDKHAEAYEFGSTDLLAINDAGTYWKNDIAGMSNLPTALTGLSGSAWIKIVRFEDHKKIYIEYDGTGGGSYTTSTTTDATTVAWVDALPGGTD